MSTFTTRISTGSLKGKPLTLPHDATVRPTRERVRMAVFNMLGSRLEWHGRTVVDVACGSGAWGLEALSRGAAEVWLIDTDTRAVQANLKALRLAHDARVHVVQADARTWQPPAPVDVVLADPPYGSPLTSALLAKAALWGAEGSWWALETGADEPCAWPQPFTNLAEKMYGVSKINVGQFFIPSKG
ncbi:MAG: RsmD family RNA methyltransferase [Alphaproteobacteria bacterium]